MRRASLLLLPLALTGCSIGGDDGLVKTVLDTHITDLIAEGIKFALLGGLIGFLAAPPVVFILAKLGAYRWEWKHAKWLRGLTYVASFVLLVGLAGAIGLFEGALRGARVVIRESQLGKDLLPALGGHVADVLAQVHLSHTTKKTPKDPEILATIEAFKAGKWELDAAGMIESLAALEATSWRALSDETLGRVVKVLPALHQKTGEAMLRWVFEAIGRALVRKAIEDKAAEAGLDLHASRLGDVLLAEAAAHGDPKTITRMEVAGVIVRELFEPSILLPLRHIVRGQQLALALGILATLLVPILFFRIAERLRAGGPKPEDDRPALEVERAKPAEPPPPPAGPTAA